MNKMTIEPNSLEGFQILYVAHSKMEKDSVVIVGGGLVGCLLAISLRNRGIGTHVLEAREDLRDSAPGGRSINLVLTSRGVHALAMVSPTLASQLLSITVPVYGRTLHSVNGELAYQPYGPDESYCNFSVSRTELNQKLIDAAEDSGAKFTFSSPLDHIDIKTGDIYTYNCRGTGGHPHVKVHSASTVFGADGGGSRCRQALHSLLGSHSSDVGVPLDSGYKELLMPANSDGSYAMDKDSLHIWPRGSHFLMALPNTNGSFTMTLYLSRSGPLSFDSLKSADDIEAFFTEYYGDAIPLMPEYLTDFQTNPVGFLGTVYCAPWHYDDKLLLIGDAAHAITPFFGQGCNSAFEDVTVLAEMLDSGITLDKVLSKFSLARKPDADAIAIMALENYVEMQAKTADPLFLLQKAVEVELSHNFPIYLSRYGMVTHSLIPYSVCYAIGLVQQSILEELCKGISDSTSIDLEHAELLIEEKLIPLLNSHGITIESYKDRSLQYYKM